jgi:hypothetical protein
MTFRSFVGRRLEFPAANAGAASRRLAGASVSKARASQASQSTAEIRPNP